MYNSILFNEGETTEAKLVLERGNLKCVPYYSVFIPTFNRPLLLEMALKSALNQEFGLEYEIVVIDNYSDFQIHQQIIEIIENLEVGHKILIKLYRCISHSNGWNMGILKSSSEFVVMLHDDDMLKSNHLNEINKILTINKDIDVLCSDSSNLIETKNLSFLNNAFMFLKEVTKLLGKKKLIKLAVKDFYYQNPASNTGVVLKRSTALKNGGFSFKDNVIPDYWFFFRIARDFNTVYYFNMKLSIIRFAVNDGLKPEIITKVKKNTELLRNEIRILIPELKVKDCFYDKCSVKLTNLESKNSKKSLITTINIFLLKIYTRSISLYNFLKIMIS